MKKNKEKFREKMRYEEAIEKVAKLNKRLAKINTKSQLLEEAEVPSDTEEEEQAVLLKLQLMQKAKRIIKKLKKLRAESLVLMAISDKVSVELTSDKL